jgi:CelD/BcsL family acetyltransferase involved in cellulose biosynthesis
MAELHAELVDQPGELPPLVGPWRALAITNALPMSLPEWALGWLRHLAPAGTAPRVVVVRDRGHVVGLVPLFVEEGSPGRIDYRLIGAPVPRLTPLAVPGREWEVAQAVGSILATADPTPDVVALEAHPLTSLWPRALAHTWPGRVAPWRVQYFIQSSPVTALGMASFDDWLATKSHNFRSEIRRRRRRFADAGGTVRFSVQDTLERDVDILLRLHRGRWEGRGRSEIVAHEDGIRRLFTQVGGELLDDGLFRLVVLEVGGRAAAAQVHAAAGGEAVFLNGGWDEEYAKLSPSVLCLAAAIEDAVQRGDQRFDLGPGAQPYKLRIADGDDPVAWTMLIPPGRRLAITATRTMPMLVRRRARDLAKRALSPDQIERLGAIRTRLTGRRSTASTAADSQ